jgi:putative hydrolase
MKYEIDSHCHSIGSGHAYSTVWELAKAAKKKKLKMIAITDHGPSLPGASHIYFIANQKMYPDRIAGVEILKGVEANITSFTGGLDVPDERLAELDIVLVGYHSPSLAPTNAADHTAGLMNIMENKYVDIIVHPGNPEFPIEIDKVLKKAKETDTLIEINNSSLWISRKGSLKNCIHIAKLCKKYGVHVVVGSDAHIFSDVGEFGKITKIFKEINMPPELISNRSVDVFKQYLRSKGKKRFMK